MATQVELPGLTDAIEVPYYVDRYGYHFDKKFMQGKFQHDGFLRRVSTHLQGIPKPWLGGWAAKAVAEYAVENWESLDTKLSVNDDCSPEDVVKELKGAPWAYRDERADRGSAIHAAVESVILDTPLPDGLDEDQLNCAIGVEGFLRERNDTILGTEVTVFNLTHGYAGTLDVWYQHDEGYGILDWKSSRSVYTEAAIQLTAYRMAEYALLDRVPVPGKSDHWVGKLIPWREEYANAMEIVHVQPDGCHLYPINYGPRMWDVFRGAAFLKAWAADTDNYRRRPKVEVFGEPIAYPTKESTA